MPKISVIIPTYNRAHLLPDAINSVLKQTYRDFEIIVVDDGSVDNTKEVVEKFSDKRIEYIKHDRNRGVSAAFNTGIKASQGEYITIVTDDNMLFPQALEKIIQKFRQVTDPNIGVISGGIAYINEEGKILKSEIFYKTNNIFEDILRDTKPFFPFFKKEIFENVGLFDESLSGREDWDMLLKIAKCYKFEFIPEILLKARVHKGYHLSSKSRISLAESNLKVTLRHLDYLQKNPKLLSTKLRTAGNLFCQAGDLNQGRSLLKESIKVNPLNLLTYLYFFISLFGVNFYRKFSRLKDRLIIGVDFG
jgi:glycosyltransferase involved in cell wall biosynthesis